VDLECSVLTKAVTHEGGVVWGGALRRPKS